jgi:hypothetical protein
MYGTQKTEKFKNCENWWALSSTVGGIIAEW